MPVNPSSQHPTHLPNAQLRERSVDMLRELYSGPVNEKMIELATHVTERAIECNPSTQSAYQVALPPLSSFIRHLTKRAKLNAATFLTGLVFLSRLSLKLPATARGMPCTRHRIFLASLLIATKYMNDVPLKNNTWAQYSFLFNVSEVNMMERQLLFLMDYDLHVNESQLATYLSLCVDTPLNLLSIDLCLVKPTWPVPVLTKQSRMVQPILCHTNHPIHTMNVYPNGGYPVLSSYPTPPDSILQY